MVGLRLPPGLGQKIANKATSAVLGKHLGIEKLGLKTGLSALTSYVALNIRDPQGFGERWVSTINSWKEALNLGNGQKDSNRELGYNVGDALRKIVHGEFREGFSMLIGALAGKFTGAFMGWFGADTRAIHGTTIEVSNEVADMVAGTEAGFSITAGPTPTVAEENSQQQEATIAV